MIHDEHLQNLKKSDMMSQSDPYVLVSVPGTNVQQERTKVVKSSAHPEWNQAYGYDVSHSREGDIRVVCIISDERCLWDGVPAPGV